MSYKVRVSPRRNREEIGIHTGRQNDNEVKQMYTSYDDLPLFLTVEDLAKALQIGLSTAYNLVRSNQIRCYRAGVQYRIPKESIRDIFLPLPDCSR